MKPQTLSSWQRKALSGVWHALAAPLHRPLTSVISKYDVYSSVLLGFRAQLHSPSLLSLNAAGIRCSCAGALVLLKAGVGGAAGGGGGARLALCGAPADGLVAADSRLRGTQPGAAKLLQTSPVICVSIKLNYVEFNLLKFRNYIQKLY